MEPTVYTGDAVFSEAYAIRDYVLAQDIGASEDEWYEKLLAMVPKARFVPIDAEPIQGQDGFLYYIVGIPPVTAEPIEASYNVAEFEELAEACIKGCGMLFFTELDASQEPFLRLTVGDMLCYLEHQTLIGVPSELEEVADPAGGKPLDIVPVDDEMLPTVARDMLEGFFEYIGFPNVGVATIVDKGSAPHRALVLNIAPEDVEPSIEEQILYRVRFFLKPLRRVYLNEFMLADEDFTPLKKA